MKTVSLKLACFISSLVISMAAQFGPARAAICAGINLPDVIEREQTLVLNGMGLRLATIFDFRVFVAGLYLPERQTNAESIIGVDQPRVLAMVFLRNVNQGEIQDGIRESIELNSDRDLSPVMDKLDMVQRLVPSLSEGQTLIFDYAPGFGTAVLVDGQTIANIEGDDFASALIALYIGNPPNHELKRGLLGGRCE